MSFLNLGIKVFTGVFCTATTIAGATKLGIDSTNLRLPKLPSVNLDHLTSQDMEELKQIEKKLKLES